MSDSEEIESEASETKYESESTIDKAGSSEKNLKEKLTDINVRKENKEQKDKGICEQNTSIMAKAINLNYPQAFTCEERKLS